jgi:hypothetical protein
LQDAAAVLAPHAEIELVGVRQLALVEVDSKRGEQPASDPESAHEFRTEARKDCVLQ